MFAAIVAAVSAVDNGQYRPYQTAKAVTPFAFKTPGYTVPVYKAPVASFYKSGVPQKYSAPVVAPVYKSGVSQYHPTPVVAPVYKSAISQYYPAPVAPVQHGSDGHWAVLRSEGEVNPDGSFHYDYETQNGIKAAEQATVQLVAPETVVQKRTGFYEYPGTDGHLYRIDYVADENGFHPTVSVLNLDICFFHLL